MVESTTSVSNFSTLLNATPAESKSPALACSLVTSLSVSSTSLMKLYVLPNFVAVFSLFLCHLSVFLELFALRVLRENTDLPPPGKLMESVDSSLSFSSAFPKSLASAIGETNLPLVSFFSDLTVSVTSSNVSVVADSASSEISATFSSTAAASSITSSSASVAVSSTASSVSTASATPSTVSSASVTSSTASSFASSTVSSTSATSSIASSEISSTVSSVAAISSTASVTNSSA